MPHIRDNCSNISKIRHPITQQWAACLALPEQDWALPLAAQWAHILEELPVVQ
jgi:hypothetical protein